MLIYELLEEALKNTPDKEAIIFKGKSTSYRELHDLMNWSARALLSLGIARGDRVAIFMENRVELVELYFACFRIGAIAVPLNHRYQTDEVVYAVNHCEAKVLIAECIKDSVPSLLGIYVFGDEPANMENSWSRILKNLPENVEWPLVGENDPAMILYTSGITNKPKGVTHTHSSIFHTASSRKISQKLTKEDVSLAATVICHAGASIGVTFPTLYAGGTVVILEKTDPVLFLEAVTQHRPTRTVILPAQLLDTVEHPRAESVDFSCLKEVECGGDQISHDLYEHFNKVAGYELNQLYGLTECEGACINPPFGLIKRGSIGKPRDVIEIRLLNPDGKDVPDGEVGEILIKSASVMIGYWNDPENTKKTFLDGWLRTGDLGRRDEDGYYYFIGRIKEVIIKGGSNVAPGEVEEVLDDHPDVIISGVVGTPDPRYGQLIHAFIELKPSLENPPGENELSAYASKRLAAYKVPDRFTLVEELPRNEVGKIDRRGLHALAAKLDSR